MAATQHFIISSSSVRDRGCANGTRTFFGPFVSDRKIPFHSSCTIFDISLSNGKLHRFLDGCGVMCKICAILNNHI